MYLLMTYDNGTIDAYQSNAYPLDDPNCAFTPAMLGLKVSESGYSEICLVTDTGNNVYMIGFRTDNLGGSNDDYGVHFRWGATVQLTSSAMTFYASQRNFVGGNWYTNTF